MPEGPAGGPRPLSESSLVLEHKIIHSEYTVEESASIESRIRDEQGARVDVMTLEDDFGQNTRLIIELGTPRSLISAVMRSKSIIEDELDIDIDNHDLVIYSDKSYID